MEMIMVMAKTGYGTCKVSLYGEDGNLLNEKSHNTYIIYKVMNTKTKSRISYLSNYLSL